MNNSPLPSRKDEVCANSQENDFFSTILSPYDANSVMMYSFCDLSGAATNGGMLSRFDVQGVRYMYSLPRVSETDYNGDALADIYFWTSSENAGDTILFGGDPLSVEPSATPGPGRNYRPLPGDFNGDGLTDIYFYGSLVGSTDEDPAGYDPLFIKEDGNNAFAVSSGFPADGPLSQPALGHFYGSDTVDILFSDIAYWSDSPILTELLMVPYSPPAAIQDNTIRFTQLVGDFDGDNSDEILWIDSAVNALDSSRYFDKDPDALWWSWQAFDHVTKGMKGTNNSPYFYTSTSGDYDGDGTQDLAWYAPGEDLVFWFGGAQGPGTEVRMLDNPFADASLYKVFSYDYLGSGSDQIYWFDQVGDTDRLWQLTALDPIAFSETIIGPVQHDESLPISGNFRQNGVGPVAAKAEIYWWDPLGTSELWVLSDSDVFEPESAPSPAGYPVGFALR